jgi:ankyrin repeat protein
MRKITRTGCPEKHEAAGTRWWKMTARVSIIALIVIFITSCSTSPLVQKTRLGDLNGIVELINNGADVNERSGVNGNTALQIAAANGRIDLVKLFLEKGAYIDAEATPCLNCEGLTPLAWAAFNYQNKMVEFLIEKGANIGRAIVGLEIYLQANFGFADDPAPRNARIRYAIQLLRRFENKKL